jgi:hypothetical protein
MDVSNAVSSYYIEKKSNKDSQMRHTQKKYLKNLLNPFQISLSPDAPSPATAGSDRRHVDQQPSRLRPSSQQQQQQQ